MTPAPLPPGEPRRKPQRWKAVVAIVVGLIAVGALGSQMPSVETQVSEDDSASTKPAKLAQSIGECVEKRGLHSAESRGADLIRAQSMRADLVRFQRFDSPRAAQAQADGVDPSLLETHVAGNTVALWPADARSEAIRDAVLECADKRFAAG